MGTFDVELRIGAADLSVWETVNALVDTGSTCSMAPASLLRRLGIEPEETVEFELAGGEVVGIRNRIRCIRSRRSEGLGAGHFRAGRRIPDGRNDAGRFGPNG